MRIQVGEKEERGAQKTGNAVGHSSVSLSFSLWLSFARANSITLSSLSSYTLDRVVRKFSRNFRFPPPGTLWTTKYNVHRVICSCSDTINLIRSTCVWDLYLIVERLFHSSSSRPRPPCASLYAPYRLVRFTGYTGILYRSCITSASSATRVAQPSGSLPSISEPIYRKLLFSFSYLFNEKILSRRWIQRQKNNSWTSWTIFLKSNNLYSFD